MKKLGHLLNIVLLSATVMTISGCGQKGPLVLPEDKPSNTQPSGQND